MTEKQLTLIDMAVAVVANRKNKDSTPARAWALLDALESAIPAERERQEALRLALTSLAAMIAVAGLHGQQADPVAVANLARCRELGL